MPVARKIVPGNPLWIEWLQEWQKEVSDQSEHLPKAIRNAIKSFQQNPVAIDHPANANTLKNVGPKVRLLPLHMIQYLTKRLKQYCEENGLDMPVARHTTFEHEAAKLNKKKRKAEAALNGGDDSDDAPPRGSGSRPAGRRIGGDDEDDEPDTSPVKKPKKARAYAPRVRSGPWAIFIGLASWGTHAWKSQDDIIIRADPFFGEEGQSLNDKSASNGGPGQHYTGWSSVSALVKKGYLEKKSRNPVLYSITHSGWKIARKAVRNAKKKNDIEWVVRRALPDFPTDDESDENDSDVENRPLARPNMDAGSSAPSGNKGKAPARQDAPQQVNVGPARPRLSAGGQPGPNDPEAPFLFSYLADGFVRVKRRDEAEVTMDQASFTTLFLVEFREAQAKHIFVKKNIVGHQELINREGPLGPEGQTFWGYMLAKVAPEMCSGFDSLKRSSSNTARATEPARPAAALRTAPLGYAPPSSDDLDEWHRKRDHQSSTATAAPRPSTSRGPVEVNRAAKDEIIDLEDEVPLSIRERTLRAAEARRAAQQSSSSSPNKLSSQSKGKAAASDAYQRLQAGAVAAAAAAATSSAVSRTSKTSGVSTVQTAAGKAVPDVSKLSIEQWRASDYEILLIIDSREKPGLSSKKLESKLTEKGIPWEARMLAMGDAIWIARHKTNGKEVVLDVCLERKRLDDLMSSLKDGRYMEQKNRMVQSGMSRLIYLVEEHDSKNAMEVHGRQIWTMKSSLQVIDNFTVHIAWTVYEAVGYLAMLTNTFQDLYSGSNLHVLPDASINRDSYANFAHHLRETRSSSHYVMTFEAYQTVNVKMHSVHTNWAKMVASINMMSLASTERLLSRWPAPGAFFSGLQQTVIDDEEAKEKMAEEEALNPNKNKRRKVDDPKVGECWIMRQTVNADERGETVRPIGQALSTHCWKLFTADKY